MHALPKLPTYSTDLIDELARLYPERCIRRGESLEEAHRYAGKRELVLELLALKQRAEANILER